MRLILPIWMLLLHMTCAWGLLIPQETRMGAEGWAAYSSSSTSTSTQASRSATRTIQYSYDDLHRLTSEVLGGSEETGTVAYTLDDVGNRLGRTSSVSGITPQSLSYSANDWLNSHQYDANGNTLRSDLTSGSVARDAYDFKNRLSQRRIYDASGTVLQKMIDLRYDGDGSLKWKRVTDTITGEETIRYFVVDHHNLTGYSQIVEELDATGAVVATYHYGHDLISQSRLVEDPATGLSEWVDRLFVYDGGGSVRALTDLEGNITDTFSYDAYGNLLQPSSLFLPTSYLYRGERYDPDLGQYYLRARFYDSNLGRFHTLDEYEGRTGEPLSLHKYLYAHANPVSGWDPSGRMTLAELSTSIKIKSQQLANGTVSTQRSINSLLRVIVTMAVGLNVGTAATGFRTGGIPSIQAAAYANRELRQFNKRKSLRPKTVKRVFRISKFIAQTAAKTALINSKALNIPVSVGLNGLPDFNHAAHPHPRAVVFVPLSGSRSRDKAMARARSRIFVSPNHAWHHHEAIGIMMLVDRRAHAAVGHAGGVFFWEILNDKDYKN